MSIQKRHARKGPFTISAVIFLNKAMGLHMSPQIRSVGKSSEANLAFKRLLAGVSPIVALLKPRTGERLAAHLALTRQSVCADVHFERARCHVALVAALALVDELVVGVRCRRHCRC